MPKDVKQEWEVFKALCPKELMKIIKCKKISFYTYENIINLMKNLGFNELSMWLLMGKYSAMYDNTENAEKLIDELSPETVCHDYNGRLFTKIFIDNIENEYLKEYFSQLNKRM